MPKKKETNKKENQVIILDENHAKNELGSTVDQKALDAFKKKYSKFVATTDAGYKKVAAAITDLRTLRTSLEARRVELKAPYLKYGKTLDAEAKILRLAIEEIEESLKQKKLAVDEKKDEEQRLADIEEEKRVAVIDKLLKDIVDLGTLKYGESSESIGKKIAALEALVIDEKYSENKKQAEIELTESLRVCREAFGSEAEKESKIEKCDSESEPPSQPGNDELDLFGGDPIIPSTGHAQPQQQFNGGIVNDINPDDPFNFDGVGGVSQEQTPEPYSKQDLNTPNPQPTAPDERDNVILQMQADMATCCEMWRHCVQVLETYNAPEFDEQDIQHHKSVLDQIEFRNPGILPF